MITESEFKKFIETIPNCESLEVSTVTGQRRADFLLNSGTIIAELKNLEVDLSQKIGQLLHDNGIIFYGKRPFNSLIEGRPDKEDLNKKAYAAVTSSLERHFRSANTQIKATSEDLGLRAALGLVIVINNENVALEPHVVVKAASQLLMKQFRGETKYSAIHGCLYLCEVHSPRNIQIQNSRALPALQMVVTGGEPYESLSNYMDKLTRHWCAFRGIRYIDGQGKTDLL